MATTLSVVVAVSALSPAVSTPAASAASGAPARPGGVALTWAPTYMSNDHRYSRAEAESVARKFDLVAGMPMAFKDHAGAMRKVNTNITLLAYANATLAQPGDVDHLPEAAYAHNVSGGRIKAPGFGTYLMEPTNSRWRETANAQCNDRSARAGYDGCLVDMLTLGIYSKGYVTALPVKPGTKSVYTQAEYREQMQRLGRYYRERSPGLVHVGNAVENTYRYWRSSVPSRPLVHSMPAAQMEDFMRGAHNSVTKFPTGEDWVREVQTIRDMESHDVGGLFTTKLWVNASAGQVRQWQKYSMATFLMGAGGHSYFAFTKSRDKAGSIGANLPYSMPKTIGNPTGAMTKQASGAYIRWFGNGASVANPTGGTVTVKLNKTLRNLDGQSVSSVTLPPHSGEVLVGGGGSTAPTPPPPTDSGDTSAPVAAFTTGWGGSRKITLTGNARDNVGVSAVRVAIRNEATRQWLRQNGTWGAYQELPVNVKQPGATWTAWDKTVVTPGGKFGVSLIAADRAGNKNQPRPWRTVNVAW